MKSTHFGCLAPIVAIFCVLCLGAGCPPKKDGTKAGATPPIQTGKLPARIDNAGSNAVAALVALDKKYAALVAENEALKQRSAIAAAQVGSANIANTNQPPSPAKEVVARETQLALTNLPPADLKEALEAERRRTAVLSGDVALTKQLYDAAQTEASRMKAEAVQLKADTEKAKTEAEIQRQKAAAAQAALVQAQKEQAAELEANRKSNQDKLDAANKKADEAVQKAYEERQNLLVRILIGIGALSILAGIGLAIATQGASAARSSIAVFCGLVCFGLAKLLSHPLFNIVFSVSCVLVVAAVGAYFWYERKQDRALKLTTTTKAEKEEELRKANKLLVHVTKAIEDARKNPEVNAVIEERLDYYTSPDSTRPAYVKLKTEVAG